MRTWLVIGLFVAVAACAPTAPVLPTRLPLTLVVELPTASSVYYADRVQVRGRAPQGAHVVVRWLDESDTLLGEERVVANDAEVWQAWQALTTDTLRLVTVQVLLGEESTPRFAQSVLVAPGFDRPDGVWGQISFPLPDSVLGGDELLVEGVFSGEADAALTVTLEAADHRIISTSVVQHWADNPYDAHLWRVDLPTAGYLQPAWVRLRDARGVLLDEVPIMLQQAAG